MSCNSTVDIYAHDTTITTERWVSSNKMFMNNKKTKSLFVHGKRISAKLDDVTPLRLGAKIDDSVVKQVSSHKILGVVIDSQMN